MARTYHVVYMEPSYGNDPYFDSVISLIHYDGADEGTTFTDIIPARSWTRSGTAVTDTAQFKWGSASMRLAVGSFESISDPGGSDWNFASNDWTIEFWWRRFGEFFNPQSYARYFATRNGDVYSAIAMFANNFSNREIYVQLSSTGASANLYDNATAITLPNDDNWHHVFLSRDGANLYGGYDGTGSLLSSGLGATALYYNASDTPIIGGNASGVSRSLYGWLDESRITNGVCRYTTSYSVPTEAFPDS